MTWRAQSISPWHLEVLQWAWEHHCPFDTGTCKAAAEGLHLDVLKWAMEHGFP